MKLQLVGALVYSTGAGKEQKIYQKGVVYDITAEQLKAIPKEDQKLFAAPKEEAKAKDSEGK
jgi:hypothetical protein